MWAYLGAGLEGLDEVRGELNGGVAIIQMVLACCFVDHLPALVSPERDANSQSQ